MGRQEDRQKILQMLAKGTISVEEADKLLSAMGLAGAPEGSTENPEPARERRADPRYLRVQVEPKSEKGDRVNIRVPFQLIRAGAKLAAFIPQDAREKVEEKLEAKGMKFDLASLGPENLDQLVAQIGDLQVDVDGEEETVRIFCE
jgi:hypothetical protein